MVMATGLTKKRNVRRGHKSSATRMIGAATGLLNAEGSDVMRLSQLSKSLQEKLDVLKTLDSEILDLVDDEAVEEEIEQADTFKEGIYATIIKIDKYCAPPPPVSATPTSIEPRDRDTSTTDSTPRVRLPKLNIKPFNGDLTAWTAFWDSYESSIHNNPSLSDIDRFNYLRSLLEHVALEAISGLPLTSANYHEAIEILRKRFGNKQQIIARHMDTLLNVDAVTSQDNLKGLRHLYDLVESHVRSLKSLGVSSDSYGTLLASVLVNKLPTEIRLIVSRKVDEDSWNLDAMLGVVGEELTARERAAITPTRTKKFQAREQATAATLLAGNSSNGPTCCYCSQAHTSSSCSTVKSAEDRRRILQRVGRCYVCLRKGHISRNCRSSMKCKNCRGRHHISICSQPSGEATRNSSVSSGSQVQHPSATNVTQAQSPCTTSGQSTSASPGLNPQAVSYTPTESTPTLWVNTDQAVLLQTAKAVAFNPNDPGISMTVRIVLDTGSQRSYITDDARQRLALDFKGEQTMSITTFGSREERPQVCKVVTVGLMLRDGEVKLLTLFSVPMICKPLASQPIAFCQESHEHLVGLDLADCSDGHTQLEVDVLVGSDQYWELITGETRRGASGPVAIDTRLGWVLSGPTSSPISEHTTHGLVTHTLRVDAMAQDVATLDDRLKTFWELESFGVPESDRSVYDKFLETVQFKDGRYEVTLPWKDSHPVLPDNYQLSLHRLQGLLRRLRQDTNVLQEYDSVIKTQIQQGIVESVSILSFLALRRFTICRTTLSSEEIRTLPS